MCAILLRHPVGSLPSVRFEQIVSDLGNCICTCPACSKVVIVGHLTRRMITGLEEALKRKDAIIRVRNAQISALWDELHTRQPWTNALSGDAPINLASETPVNASRKLLVIGINTVSLLF